MRVGPASRHRAFLCEAVPPRQNTPMAARSRSKMRLSEIGELTFVRNIRDAFTPRSREVITGIGDDAAVIAPRGQQLLMTTDMMVEGIHFDLRFVTPSQLGFKIVSVNVSDIYAMGGEPAFLLLDIAAGKATEGVFLASFLYGVRKALDFYRVDLVGGDLSSTKGGMAVSATVIGYGKRPILRSGARPGDRIYVTGNLGDSACGLELLRKIRRPVSLEQEVCKRPPVAGGSVPKRRSRRCPEAPGVISKLAGLGIAWNDAEAVIRRHVMPEARNPRGIRDKATAMIDISDGLFIDLSRLCEESNAGARVFMEKIPLSGGMRRAARALGIEPHRLATGGGEDYELLFTAPARRKIAFPCIGEITLSGMVVEGPGKRECELRPEGYTHWG